MARQSAMNSFSTRRAASTTGTAQPVASKWSSGKGRPAPLRLTGDSSLHKVAVSDHTATTVADNSLHASSSSLALGSNHRLSVRVLADSDHEPHDYSFYNESCSSFAWDGNDDDEEVDGGAPVALPTIPDDDSDHSSLSGDTSTSRAGAILPQAPKQTVSRACSDGDCILTDFDQQLHALRQRRRHSTSTTSASARRAAEIVPSTSLKNRLKQFERSVQELPEKAKRLSSSRLDEIIGAPRDAFSSSGLADRSGDENPRQVVGHNASHSKILDYWRKASSQSCSGSVTSLGRAKMKEGRHIISGRRNSTSMYFENKDHFNPSATQDADDLDFNISTSFENQLRLARQRARAAGDRNAQQGGIKAVSRAEETENEVSDSEEEGFDASYENQLRLAAERSKRAGCRTHVHVKPVEDRDCASNKSYDEGSASKAFDLIQSADVVSVRERASAVASKCASPSTEARKLTAEPAQRRSCPSLEESQSSDTEDDSDFEILASYQNQLRLAAERARKAKAAGSNEDRKATGLSVIAHVPSRPPMSTNGDVRRVAATHHSGFGLSVSAHEPCRRAVEPVVAERVPLTIEVSVKDRAHAMAAKWASQATEKLRNWSSDTASRRWSNAAYLSSNDDIDTSETESGLTIRHAHDEEVVDDDESLSSSSSDGSFFSADALFAQQLRIARERELRRLAKETSTEQAETKEVASAASALRENDSLCYTGESSFTSSDTQLQAARERERRGLAKEQAQKQPNRTFSRQSSLPDLPHHAPRRTASSLSIQDRIRMFQHSQSGRTAA